MGAAFTDAPRDRGLVGRRPACCRISCGLGDCVIAGGYHVEAVWTGNAGQLFTATDAQIVADYGAIGGYVPGDPSTDNGCDEQTAFNYWTKTGFANGTTLAGWLAVDAARL